jgi:hypothetical protein
MFTFGDLPLFAVATPATASAEHQQSQDGLSLARLSQLLVTQRGRVRRPTPGQLALFPF